MKTIIFISILLLSSIFSYGQVLETEVHPDHVLLPRLTTAQRNALTPKVGMMIFNLSIDCVEFFTNNGWLNYCGCNSSSNPVNMLIGGSSNETFSGIIEAHNGGFLSLSETNSLDGDVSSISNGNTDYWLVKYQENGTINWQKKYGSNFNDHSADLAKGVNSSYFLTGRSYSSNVTGGNSGVYDVWTIKVDIDGNVIWDISIGGNDRDIVEQVTGTSDGGAVITGYSYSSVIGNDASNGNRDYFIVKIGSVGNIEWSRLIGGSDDDFGRAGIQTNDGNIVIVGTSNSNNGFISTPPNNGKNFIWVVKLDITSGSIIWDRTISGNSHVTGNDILEEANSNLLISGSARANNGIYSGNNGSTDYHVTRLNPLGNVLEAAIYGGNNTETALEIIEAFDGNYVIVGSTHSSGPSGDISSTNNGLSDICLIKVDKNLDLLWEKIYGGDKSERIVKVAEVGNDIIIGSETQSSATGDVLDTSHGLSDIWILRTNLFGL